MRSKDLSNEGILTMVDALVFVLTLLIVSMFILSFFQTGFFQTSDIRRSKFRREAVIDIQEASINSVIEKTGYINKSNEMNQEVVYRNITAETAILNYLYLSESEKENDRLSYELSRLKDDIEETYNRCVWEISHYHFAVEAEYGSSEFFISDVKEVTSEEELSLERSATSTFTTLDLERVKITLYIWR